MKLDILFLIASLNLFLFVRIIW